MSQPGYPLPDGELGSDDIVCQLVYLPDRPEYWQALIGTLSYLATWRAWERDDDKRGKDAASDWRAALELTMECWRMACLEQLQNDVAAILLYLQNSDSCCDENTTFGPSDDYTTTIDPGVGDDPTVYGETAVADWDEWLEHLCYTSHAWVDTLIANTLTAAAGLESGGISVTLVAGVLAGIAFVLTGGLLAVGFVMLAVAGMVTGLTHVLLEDAADDIETARDDIVCALQNGHSLSAAVAAAVGTGAAWDYFYSLIDYDTAQAILYEGGNGTTYLDSETRDDCICIPDPEDGIIYALAFESPYTSIEGTLRKMFVRGAATTTYWNGTASVEMVPLGDPSYVGLGLAVAEADYPVTIEYVPRLESQFRKDENIVYIRMQKVLTHSYAFTYQCDYVHAWISTDGGSTGTWRRCQLTPISYPTYFSVRNEPYGFQFARGTSSGSNTWDCTFSVLME